MNVCDASSFDFDDQLQVWYFGSYFSIVVGNTIQSNGFYSYTMDDICNTLTDPLNGNPLERYSIMTQQIYGTTECIEVDYNRFLDLITIQEPNP